MNRKTFPLLFSLGVILRIVWINVPPLWYDENFTLLLARMPFIEMIKATAGDVHPPLWYIIEWAWMHGPLGFAPWMIRVPALLCSIAALFLFAVVLMDLQLSPRVQTAAYFLMAVMPFQLWYAQEGRMYALLELEVILAFLCMFHFQWGKLFIISVLMMWTQNYAFFYLGTIWLVSLVMQLEITWKMGKVMTITKDMIKGQLMPALITACILVAAAVLYLPWVKVIATQMTTIQGNYWIMDKSIGAVLVSVYKVFMTASAPNAWFVASYLVTFTTLLVGLYAFIRFDHPARLTIALMAFSPLFMAWAVSCIWQPVLLFRPLIGISPFLYIVAVWWIDDVQASEAQSKVFAAVTTIPVIVASLYGYYLNIGAMKGEGAVSSMGKALAYVDAHWQPGDVIYATDDGPFVNLAPYTNKPLYKMPVCQEKGSYAPTPGSLSSATRAALGMQVTDLRSIPHQRAWIFAPFSPLHPNCYFAQVHQIIADDKPAYVVDNNEWLHSGVWLVEK